MPPPPLMPPPTYQARKMKFQQLSYTFFSKTMGSKLCIMERSAGPFQQKKAALGNEIVRRLMNISPDRKVAEKLEIIEEFIVKLEKSVYDGKQRKEIVESGLIGYVRRMERQDGIRHRKCANFMKQRANKKLTGKTNWFKNISNETTKTNKEKKNVKPTKPKK